MRRAGLEGATAFAAFFGCEPSGCTSPCLFGRESSSRYCPCRLLWVRVRWSCSSLNGCPLCLCWRTFSNHACRWLMHCLLVAAKSKKAASGSFLNCLPFLGHEKWEAFYAC